MKILLIDDEPILLRGVVNIIEKDLVSSAIIQLATTVKESIDILSTFNPDVVFVDINIPVMDGFDFIDAVCGKVSCRRFVILTCDSKIVNARKFASHCVYEFLLKPLDKVKLHELLLKIDREIREEDERIRNNDLSKLKQTIFDNVPLDQLFHSSNYVKKLFK